MNIVLKSFCVIFLLLNINNCAVIGIATTATTGAMIEDERSVGNIIDDKVIATKIRHQYVKNNEDNSFICFKNTSKDLVYVRLC